MDTKRDPYCNPWIRMLHYMGKGTFQYKIFIMNYTDEPNLMTEMLKSRELSLTRIRDIWARDVTETISMRVGLTLLRRAARNT